MRTALTYRGALKILGAADGSKLSIIDRFLGGAILGSGAVGLPAVFALVDQKNEATKLTGEILALARGRWGKTAGHSRHELLAAAHTTIAVTALFEEFAALVGDDVYEQLEISDLEKLWVMAGSDVLGINNVKLSITQLLDLEVPLPTPVRGFESVANEYLVKFYAEAGLRLGDFLRGLKDAKLIKLGHWSSLSQLSGNAVRRYREYYQKLAVDVPEFYVWAMLQGASFVERTSVRIAEMTGENSQALAKMERMLRSIVDRDSLGEQARMLDKLNSAYLHEPLAQVDLDSDALSFPTVESGFVTPGYRVDVVDRDSNVAAPGWWRRIPVRDNLDEFLVGYLSSPDAAVRPLVVLGHPGAGKSMLTKVLAARLPTNLFVTAWVPLRRVDPDAPVHRQIEQAIDELTNGRVSWLNLSEACQDVTRVVVLDGLDELMQATGVVQSRYIEDLVEFQQRERQLGRPVSIVLTSRTVVADRARIPPGCVILRIEEFDKSRIGEWLDHWRATNSSLFRSGVYRALTVESALACSPLSSQPLLLMMIALYAANPDVPEPGGDDVTLGALYRSLVDEFIMREVAKDTLSDRVDEKTLGDRRLSLGFTSFAMFNRGRLYVDDRTLERDFERFYGEDADPEATSFDERLTRPQRTIGGFFFIHKSEAGREDTYRKRRSYEFLHASVGEFLIARTVHDLMRDAAAVQRDRRNFAGVRVSADVPGGDHGVLLMELLAFQAMTKRPNITGFLGDLGSLGTEGEKQLLLEYTRTLLDHVFDHGVPVRHAFTATTQVSRQATMLANLISVTVALNGPTGVVDFSATRTLERWRSMVRLLRAGLDAESWLAFSAAYVVTQTGRGAEMMDRVDKIAGTPAIPPSTAETADIAEHVLLALSQAELRLSTGGLYQLMRVKPRLRYMIGYFGCLAALLVYRNAETDPNVYRELASQVLSYPKDANQDLLDTVPSVLDVATHDQFDASDEVREAIEMLLVALRLQISNYDPPKAEWTESAADWLRNEYMKYSAARPGE
jgi:hypothetical protein